MARRRKLRVNLKDIRKPIDAIDATLAKAMKNTDINKGDVNALRAALKRIRSAVASECCNNAWFCEFDV